LLLATVLVYVQGVDRGNFKTCDQSGFCNRLRNAPAAASDGSTGFRVDPSTVSVGPDSVLATLVNAETEVRFQLELWAVNGGGVFRFKIKEAYPLKERFQVPEVLVSEPEVIPVEVKVQTDDLLEVAASGKVSSSVKVHSNPFKLEFFRDDVLVMTANGAGKLAFEETKAKTEENSLQETFKGHTDTMPNGHTGLRLDFTFEDTRFVYGLPEHTDGLALKDTVNGGDPYRLYNLDVFEYELNERMALYASIPFMQSHSAKQSTGLFWLNAAETWVDVSTGKAGDGILGTLSGMMSGGGAEKAPEVQTTWISESGIIDAFVLLGPGPKDVSAQFGALTGTTPLPPFFALGYHQCRWNYRDMDDVREVNANLDAHDIPSDVIWLDIEHTDGKRYFTWDSSKFGKPEEMIAGLAGVGRKLVTIVDPHVKVDSGYNIYQECKDKDLFVKDKTGNEFNGWCWPGNSAYSDFLNPDARDYYADQYKLDKYKGSTEDLHVWNDMNEPSVFNGPEVTMHKDNLHHGGVEHRDMHNIYGHLYTMATYEGLLRRSEAKLRPFVLTRSAFAGTQRYAALWTGDNTAAWDHLAASVPMCLSLSLAGITFCGADIGGFFGNPDADLMIRWYQAAVFQPFFRSHAHIDTKRREPWVFGEEKMAFMREAIKARYALLPLWYTLFYQLEMETGTPPMRPLFYEFPEDANTYPIDNAHMVGDALLVTPVTQPNVQSWDVYLPGGGALWYEFKSGRQESRSGQTISVPVDMHTVPVYQCGGSIVPTLERARRSTQIMLNDPYTLTVALDSQSKAAGALYIDDGKSYEYRSGKANYVKMKFEANKLTGVNNEVSGLETSAWLERVKILGFPAKPVSVAVEDRQLEFKYDEQNRILVIRKPDIALGSKQWSISITV